VAAATGLRVPRLVALAIAAAFLLRLVFAFGYWVGKPLNHDEHEYLQLGENLAAGHGFGYQIPVAGEVAPQQFGRAPLYPVFVAAAAVVVAPATLVPALKIAQSALGALSVWLLWLVASRAAGDRAGVLAAWIAAVYPPLVWLPAFMLSESLYIVLALSNVLLLQAVFDRARQGSAHSRGRGLLTGIVGGLAALTRPAHVFFIGLATVWMLWNRKRPMAALVVLGAAMVIGPWTARNYATFGTPVLIASEGGITFWTGNHPMAIGEGDMAANPAIKRDNQRVRAANPGLTPEQLEPVYYREALGFIASHLLWWLTLEAKKLFYLWVPVGPSYRLHSRLFLYATWVSYGLILPFGAVGLVRIRRGPHPPTALLLLLASAVVACLIFLPQERFRIPVIDPALIVGAAAVVAARGGRTAN
jgi:hypothetical protein